MSQGEIFGLQPEVTFAVLTRRQIVDIAQGRLTLGAVRVYLALYARADFKTWTCFPSYDRLQEDLGISRDTISKSLDKLCKAGWVEKWKQRSDQGRQSKTVYFLPHPLCWISGRQTAPLGEKSVSQIEQSLLEQTQLSLTVTRTHSLNEEQHTTCVEAAPRRGWSTKDWEDLEELWRGRGRFGRGARGAFFQLAKRVEWAYQGEKGLRKRLEHWLECHEHAGWSKNNLANLLQGGHETLSDAELEGLWNDTHTKRVRS